MKNVLSVNHDYITQMFLILLINELESIKNTLLCEYVKIPEYIPEVNFKHKLLLLKEKRLKNYETIERIKRNIQILNYMTNDEIWKNFTHDINTNIEYIKFNKMIDILCNNSCF